jgi:hypothetical protein
LAAQTTLAAYATNLGGTIPNGSTVAFQDFIAAGSGLLSNPISANGVDGGAALSNVTFLGCRFQANAVSAGRTTNIECYISGSSGITFSYCSVVPLLSLHPVVPAGSWPAASAGTGVNISSGNYGSYVIPYQDGSLFGVQLAGPNNTLDHCDIWGCGNLTQFQSGSSGMIIRDCWIHDARNQSPPGWSAVVNYKVGDCVLAADNQIYITVTPNINQNPSGGGNANWSFVNGPGGDHTDGAGYYAGAAAPINCALYHNTISMLGTTDLIGMQTTSSPYQNWTMVGNYLSGNHISLEGGSLATGTNSNLIFRDNTFATDVSLETSLAGFGLVNHTSNAVWRANGNVWRNNTLRVFPGDTWSGFTSGQNGQFVYPDNSINATDFS